MNMKKREGTEKRACTCVSIALVVLLFFSVAALSIVPVSANVQIDQTNGTWSDSFDGANPEAGIAASTNITVADGDANLSKTSSNWMQTTQAEFEAGVLNNVDTATSSGDVRLVKKEEWRMEGMPLGLVIFDVAIGDGDNDNRSELYLASEDGHIYQSTRKQEKLVDMGSGKGPMYGVAIGDGNNDGRNEVYGANEDGSIYQFQWNGGKWIMTKIGQAHAKKQAAMLDVAVGDGNDNEVVNEVYGASKNGHIYEFYYRVDIVPRKPENATPVPLPNKWKKVDMGSGECDMNGVAIGDCWDKNKDMNEVYGANGAGCIYLFVGEGDRWKQMTVGCVKSSTLAVATGDGNNDGKNEVYGAYKDTSINQFQWDGNEWKMTPVDSGKGPMLDVTVGDGNNDNKNEVYGANDDCCIYQFQLDGKTWIPMKIGHGERAMLDVTVGDGDEDGRNEVYGTNEDKRMYQFIWVTGGYVSSGAIASQVLDTGAAGANWTELNWSETLEADTDITFEVRASDTSFAKDASTPSWTSVGGASPVTSELPSGRYVQWRATLSTSDNSKTPTLHDVTVSYSYFNTPANLTSIAITPADLGGWSKFYADTTAPSGTSITFSILNATTNSTLISGISAADAENGYDISSIATANASIRLYALLNTSNASNTAELHEWNVSWTVTAQPTNLTIITAGSSMDLSWNGTADGEYDIYVTDDFAAGFPPAPHATVTGLSWNDTDAANHTEKYYRVGAKGSGAEEGAGTVGKYNVATGSTWTLVSLPFIPEDTSINEVIGDQLTGGLNDGESDRIWMWTGTTYKFAWLFDSNGEYPEYDDIWYGSLTSIEPDKGYWIEIKEGHTNDKIVTCGKVSDTGRSIPVNVGWNLVGQTFSVSVSLADSGLSETGFTGGLNDGESDRIWMWTGTTYKFAWLFDSNGEYPEYDGTWYGSLTTLEPGKGYWLEIKDGHSGFTWNYPKPY